jgi:hypothetical protein
MRSSDDRNIADRSQLTTLLSRLLWCLAVF